METFDVLGAVTISLAMTSDLLALSLPSKPTMILCTWCDLMDSVVLVTWKRGLSMANVKLAGVLKTFLKDMLVVPPDFTV